MKTTYILDTNVLLSDPNALFSFGENDLVIPLVVLEELDRHKDRQDEVGRNARETVRKLYSLAVESNSFKFIPLLDGKAMLKILSADDMTGSFESLKLPSELPYKTGDNQILALCLGWMKKNPKSETVLVSRDVLLRLKAGALNIPSEDYKKLPTAESATSLYTGVTTLLGGWDLEKLHKEGSVILPDGLAEQLNPNQFVILKNREDSSGSALCRYMDGGKLVKVTEFAPCKVSPRNKEQKFALDLLLNQGIPLATIVGKAGCGKTFLAIAAGLHQVLNTRHYKSLVICRPIQPLGKDLGYLPGTLEEKLEPWTAPIKDNLRALLVPDGKKSQRGEDTLQMLFENGTIEVEAMTYIRGRSIANAYMIIDEAQNLSAHELKTIITRVGEGTKIVLTGDIEQIDSSHLDSVSNGLTVAIEKFKGSPLAGHVTLLKGERSVLATLAANIL